MIINSLNPSICSTVMFCGIGLVVLRLLFIGGAILDCLKIINSKTNE
ncbi:hypothetical protein [Clostridium butyricum]